jgi:hypothetical protein
VIPKPRKKANLLVTVSHGSVPVHLHEGAVARPVGAQPRGSGHIVAQRVFGKYSCRRPARFGGDFLIEGLCRYRSRNKTRAIWLGRHASGEEDGGGGAGGRGGGVEGLEEVGKGCDWMDGGRVIAKA